MSRPKRSQSFLRSLAKVNTGKKRSSSRLSCQRCVASTLKTQWCKGGTLTETGFPTKRAKMEWESWRTSKDACKSFKRPKQIKTCQPRPKKMLIYRNNSKGFRTSQQSNLLWTLHLWKNSFSMRRSTMHTQNRLWIRWLGNTFQWSAFDIRCATSLWKWLNLKHSSIVTIYTNGLCCRWMSYLALTHSWSLSETLRARIWEWNAVFSTAFTVNGSASKSGEASSPGLYNSHPVWCRRTVASSETNLCATPTT